MSRRRSRLEIMLEILSIVGGGKDKPTNIMYSASLSWKPTQRILSYMVEQGLVEMMMPPPGKSRRRYVITEKGVNVLNYFERANEVLPPEEYANLYDLPYSIVRYGSLYGERADEHNGLYRMLRQAVEKREISHSGDGEEMREYIHAIDAAKLSVNIIEDDEFINQHTILTGVEKRRQRDLLLMIQPTLR